GQVLEIGAGGGLDPPQRMLDAPDLELLLDDALDLGTIAAPELEQAGQQRARLALEPRVAVGELVPGGGLSLDRGAVQGDVGALDRDRADVLPVAAGIAVDRPAHRPGDPGGELEPG